VLYLVYAIHVIVCLFLILVVLLQQGKGADLSVFGGGSTQTAFGAVGATSLLHKLTVGSFILFILTTMTIAVTQTNRRGESTVLSDSAAVQEQAAEQKAAQEEAAAETPATETPAESQAADAVETETAPAQLEAVETPSGESGSKAATGEGSGDEGSGDEGSGDEGSGGTDSGTTP
jgi:preprotein translocase subunit SecG